MSVPPVLVSAVGAVLWAVGVGGVGVTDSSALLAVYVAVAGAGLLLQLVGTLFYVMVMGGATRTLVAHLLSGEAVTVRAVYRSVRERFWRLVGAGLVVGFWMGVTGTVAAFVWFVLVLTASLVVSVLGFGLGLPEWAVGVAALGLMLLAAFATLAVFFYLGGLLAYVLQAMMVEGRGVFEAVNRSTKLARRHLRRLATVFFFTTFASISAWMLLVTPLIYVGVAEGYSLNPWSASEAPVWYRIGFQVMWQASSILLAPVWMLGLSLLYIDERVRQEGYDIELAAARVFGTMPDVPQGYAAPLSPALSSIAHARRIT